jgi:4'-phosphopantetheinyl transferase
MPASVDWSDAPTEPRLGDGDVHIWRAFLDREHAAPDFWERVLTAQERERASRFVFARDRKHFIAGRGILRAILGLYLRTPAATIELAYGPEGKPTLGGNADPLRFNLSHSQGLAVYAFSRTREIGIDLEAIRSGVTGQEIAEHYFSAKELAELRSLPREQQDEGFFLCWTRKEAYIKARGSGLAIPLDSFDVSLTPGMPVELVADDSARWTLRSFLPAEGYAGAVVAEGRDWEQQLWNWNGA